MDRELLEKFKIEYLNNPNKNVKEIAESMALSKNELSVILKTLKISPRRRRHYILDESYFHDINSPNKAYFLGLIAADGYIKPPSTFVLTSKDVEVLQKLLDEMNAEGVVFQKDKGNFENSKDCYSIRISSKEIVSDLSSHGIYQNKSFTYSKIPQIPKNFLWDYLRGYIDGDGSVSFTERTYFIKGRTYTYPRLSVSFIATMEFIDAVVSTFKINSFHVHESHSKGLYYIQIGNKKDLIRLYSFLYNEYSDAYIQRKKDNWDRYMCAINPK